MLDVIAEQQKLYKAKFMEKLDKFGVNTPTDLNETERKQFYREVRSEPIGKPVDTQHLIQVAGILSELGSELGS